MQLVVPTFLRRALAVDAIASGATALMTLVGASPLAGMMAVPEQLLRYSGAALVPFVIFVAYTARSDVTTRGTIVAIIALNAAWVAASIVVLASRLIEPNALGYAFMLGQAVAVGVFAELQFVGLQRGKPLPAT